ncbi:hypothetical protein ES705_29652 [subsurface metagenome]
MPEIQEEEIDLREYINVLLKRKGVIILIFLIAIITAALVSYFALSPVYQASMVFNMAQISEPAYSTGFSVVQFNNRPIVHIAEALEIIKSNIVLDEVINRMGLEGTLTSEQLKPHITTENLKSTNFIRV